jgi:hypothetical protein
MAFTYKVLGQSAPSATTNTDAYTVGSGKQAIVSTITIANRSAGSKSYRIAIRPAGATLANQHYIAYDIAIAANDTTALTLGIALGAADVVTVYASSADLSFGVFGSEIS